jgi:hypothetical protein
MEQLNHMHQGGGKPDQNEKEVSSSDHEQKKKYQNEFNGKG